MTELESLLGQAERAAASGRFDEALAFSSRAVTAAAESAERFDALLHRARAEFAKGNLEVALATYWEARNFTKRRRLGRSGEADLGIGMMLLDLGRPGEGLEAVRRAARQFRKGGNTYLRGCAEMVLADEALRSGSLDIADRHLEVAADLLEASAEPRMLSGALTLRAEVLARQGQPGPVRALLVRAERVAADVVDARIREELAARRRDVQAILAASQG